MIFQAAVVFALQAAAAQPALNTTPTPWPDPERELRNAGAMDSANSPEARIMMARLAACVVDESPAKVADVLARDFRTTSYRNGLRNLMRSNDGCSRKARLRGTIRMEELPFAAALAETMLGRDAKPLNARLAMAAAGPEAPTYSPSDTIAMCVARSAPDDVAALLGSEPGYPSEIEALGRVEKVARACSGGRKLEISPIGLRSIVATASYRLLASPKT